MDKSALAEGLHKLRNRALFGLLLVTAGWLCLLSYFYLASDSPVSRLNIYAVMSGALCGFTFTIQVIGLTVSRLQQVVNKLARFIYKENTPMFINTHDEYS